MRAVPTWVDKVHDRDKQEQWYRSCKSSLHVVRLRRPEVTFVLLMFQRTVSRHYTHKISGWGREMYGWLIVLMMDDRPISLKIIK